MFSIQKPYFRMARAWLNRGLDSNLTGDPLPSRSAAPRWVASSHPFRRRIVAAAAAVVLAACIGAGASEPAIAAPGSSVVIGVAVGTDGAPAVGIQIDLWKGSIAASRTVTDENGAYRFESLSADRYSLSFACAAECVGNYVTLNRGDPNAPQFDLGDGDYVELHTELTSAGEISGIVGGDDGAVVDGATVYIEAVDPEIVSPQSFAITDAEGRYRFRNLRESGYRLQFGAPTMPRAYFNEYWKDQSTESASDVIEVAAGQAVTGIDAQLTPTAWISGQVMNEDGVPFDVFDDVDVFLYRITDAGASWVWTVSPGAYPNGPGEFRFDSLEAGTYVLFTRTWAWGGVYGVGEWWQDKPDLASANRIVVAAGDRTDVTVVLDGGPVDLVGPSIEGTPQLGSTLSAVASSRTSTATIAYQWTANDEPIDGATASTFTPALTEIGKTIRVQASAKATGRITAEATSNATTAVTAGVLSGPVPTIGGEARVGSTLIAQPGEWTSGTVLSYRWLRSGVPVATGPELVLSDEYAGSRVLLEVTGTKPGYTTATRRSAPSPTVLFGPVDLTEPKIAGAPEVGSTLTVDATSSTPGVGLAYQWYANGNAIPGQTGSSIEVDDSLLGARLSVTVQASANAYAPVTLASAETEAIRFPSWGEVSRFDGPDRYTSSAAISAANFDSGVPVAYIANGLTFADALSGAPAAAASGGPILLSQATTVPAAVLSELERLQPQRVVVLGGPASISSDIAAQLDSLTSGTVTRLHGPDRYTTSAAISEETYEPGVPVAYIANAFTFADALSGAPVAGRAGGPVLLSSSSALSTAVIDELVRLKPQRIVILGGPASISSDIAAQLDSLTSGTVTRLHGPDRYTTSAAISAETYEPGVPVAYIANAFTFADALSGAPVAGRAGGPVLLSSSSALSTAVIDELVRLKPQRIVILGGPASIDAQVAARLDWLQ